MRVYRNNKPFTVTTIQNLVTAGQLEEEPSCQSECHPQRWSVCTLPPTTAPSSSTSTTRCRLHAERSWTRTSAKSSSLPRASCSTPKKTSTSLSQLHSPLRSGKSLGTPTFTCSSFDHFTSLTLVIYLAAWLFKLHLYLLTLIYFGISTSPPENTFNIIKPLINGNIDLNSALLQKRRVLRSKENNMM